MNLFLAGTAEGELDGYFSGKIQEFKTPLFLLGSPFQKRIWEELQKIPRGETRSYAEIAKAIEDLCTTDPFH
ncbi:MAG: methylated-DNA--[protein]-cysteine S-methyltransferase [Ignavibacteriae bacterium]|nr:methylated-DNA--[protein]-cysteine S-methyltransferase [Ignavibacteriota bacterium]